MSTKDFSSKQEKTVAKYLGWDTVPASGGADHVAGDIISSKFLGECKTRETLNLSIRFHKSHWDKIVEEAMVLSRTPVLICDDGSQDIRHNFFLIDRLTCEIDDKFTLINHDFSYRKNLCIKYSEIHRLCKSSFMPIIHTDWYGDKYVMDINVFNEYQKLA